MRERHSPFINANNRVTADNEHNHTTITRGVIIHTSTINKHNAHTKTTFIHSLTCLLKKEMGFNNTSLVILLRKTPQ